MTEAAEWLEWGGWSVASFVTLAAGIIGTVLSAIGLVKAGKQK